MRGHLTDAELTEALGGEPQGETLSHLAACPICRAERDRLREVLASVAGRARVEAEWPEESWDRQRLRIVSQLDDRPSRFPSWRWAWAPAAAGLAVLAFVWFRWEAPHQPQGPETDQAILIGVERSLQTDVPVALRPAALLVAEFERSGTETEVRDGTPKGDQL